MSDRILLVTDLDGTLLGDASALEQFRLRLQMERRAVTLVYASGRTVEAVRHAVAQDHLPIPDYVIGSVGTELSEFITGAHDECWELSAGRAFDVKTIRRVAAKVAALKPQPDEFQSSRKASYFIENAAVQELHDLAAMLESAEVDADLFYSGNRYLDILPQGMNKGGAATFLARKLHFDATQVIVCGDSGNDLSLYLHGFCGVLVANAETELVRRAAGPVYHSPFAYAAGVLDGIRHWIHESNFAGLLGGAITRRAP